MLTKCPDCGHDISSEAPACPYCGKPNYVTPPRPSAASQSGPKNKPQHVPTWIVLAVVIGLPLFIWISVSSGKQSLPQNALVDVNLGSTYLLHSGYPLCIDKKGLDAIATADAASDSIGAQHAEERYGCFGTSALGGDQVKAINTGFDAVRVRLPSGTAMWTYTEAIKKE